MTLLTNTETGERYEVVSTYTVDGSIMSISQLLPPDPEFTAGDVINAIEAYLAEGSDAVKREYDCSNGWEERILRWHLKQLEGGELRLWSASHDPSSRS